MREPDFNDADWSVALDVQLDLHRWWGTDSGRRVAKDFGQSYGASYLDQQIAESEYADQPAMAFAAALMNRPSLVAPLDIDKHERMALGKAATYFVSAEMVEFASWVAQNMGDTTNLDMHMIPHEAGFVWIDGGMPIIDAHGHSFVISALSWSTDAFDDPNVKAVDYAVYSNLLDDRDTSMDSYRVQEAIDGPQWDHVRRRPELRAVARTAITHIGALIFGERSWPTIDELTADGADLILAGGRRVTAGPEHADALQSTLNTERWLIAFWMLIDDRITLVDKHFPGRAARRRFQREVRPNTHSPDETSVRTVTLRRAVTPTSHDDGPGEDESWVRWSHRWWVNPHWRRIHKGTDKERVVRVRGHVKGPDSAPLVLRDSVARWVR